MVLTIAALVVVLVVVVSVVVENRFVETAAILVTADETLLEIVEL